MVPWSFGSQGTKSPETLLSQNVFFTGSPSSNSEMNKLLLEQCWQQDTIEEKISKM